MNICPQLSSKNPKNLRNKIKPVQSSSKSPSTQRTTQQKRKGLKLSITTSQQTSIINQKEDPYFFTCGITCGNKMDKFGNQKSQFVMTNKFQNLDWILSNSSMRKTQSSGEKSLMSTTGTFRKNNPLTPINKLSNLDSFLCDKPKGILLVSTDTSAKTVDSSQQMPVHKIGVPKLMKNQRKTLNSNRSFTESDSSKNKKIYKNSVPSQMVQSDAILVTDPQTIFEGIEQKKSQRQF